MLSRIEREIQAAMDEARREALEQAAQFVANSARGTATRNELAEGIRALKESAKEGTSARTVTRRGDIHRSNS